MADATYAAAICGLCAKPIAASKWRTTMAQLDGTEVVVCCECGTEALRTQRESLPNRGLPQGLGDGDG